MDIKSLADKPQPDASEQHQEKIARLVRSFTSSYIHFRPRTRAILVFIGAIAIIIAWLTPWYASLFWTNSGAAVEAALHSGYEVTNLSPGDAYAKYGLNPMLHEVTGRDLAAQPGALGAIAFSRSYFYEWIGLAVLALLAMWTYERPETMALHRLRRRCYTTIESGKKLLLLWVAVQALWKGIDAASKAKVNGLALQSLDAGLSGAGVPASAVQHFVTNYSTGITLLPIGIIFAALGALSGDKKPKTDSNGNPVPSRVRFPAKFFAVAAIFIVAIMVALFTG